MPIFFHSEDIVFDIKKKNTLKRWISTVVEKDDKKIGVISIIFCSDKKILEINKQYLEHDYHTDIISFDYSQAQNIAGDVFISVETVLENSFRFKTDFATELRRVIIHGILHFLGYKDKTSKDSVKMRSAENDSLILYNTIVPRGTKK